MIVKAAIAMFHIVTKHQLYHAKWLFLISLIELITFIYSFSHDCLLFKVTAFYPFNQYEEPFEDLSDSSPFQRLIFLNTNLSIVKELPLVKSINYSIKETLQKVTIICADRDAPPY